MRPLRVAALWAASVAVVAAALSVEALTGSSRAGLSSSGVSGYAISDVDYRLAADPTRVVGVSFLLDAEPQGEIRVRVAEGQPWATCRVDGRHAACSLVASVAVRHVDRLDVVAAA